MMQREFKSVSLLIDEKDRTIKDYERKMSVLTKESKHVQTDFVSGQLRYSGLVVGERALFLPSEEPGVYAAFDLDELCDDDDRSISSYAS